MGSGVWCDEVVNGCTNITIIRQNNYHLKPTLRLECEKMGWIIKLTIFCRFINGNY